VYNLLNYCFRKQVEIVLGVLESVGLCLGTSHHTGSLDVIRLKVNHNVFFKTPYSWVFDAFLDIGWDGNGISTNKLGADDSKSKWLKKAHSGVEDLGGQTCLEEGVDFDEFEI